MTTFQQFSPKQSPTDLTAPAMFSGGTNNNFASLLRATKPVRIRIQVTPEMAKQWLETTNIKNRPISEMHWMKIWLDIVEARWRYNGEPISFGSNGALLNGQHRLRACAESETAIDTDVIFGLDPDVMNTIDIGKVRTAANIAHLEGVENATGACAAAHLILLHENGGIQQLGNKQAEPSKTKINERVRTDPRISEVAGRISNMGRGLASPRVLTFCYYLFSAQNQDLTDRFFGQFESGTRLNQDNPVYILRERLRTNSISKAKLPLLEIVALFFKAWIAYRAGKTMKSLRWNNGGNNPEKFPEI
ncbi:MAG: hypothetical protein IT165_06315 [Bryobacterales bacterium]|nr:hypothetical protein [Bryobacterales bacterium]